MRDEIVRVGMHNDTFADNIDVGTRADLPEIRRQCNTACAIFSDADIANIPEMKLIFSPFSVRNIRGIPVTPGGFTVG